jgi:excinuclease ABC subunit A
MSEPTHISVRNAREHNLRGVDIDVPRDALVVFSGVSGSGKSSLAFDTIHQEGQRRFLESLSAYARQFLGQMERPKADAIEGLSPTVCIDQKTVNRNPRSTVGTVTEIYDHLRLLMARLGTPHCPVCGRVIARLAESQVVDQVLAQGAGARVQVLGPIVRERKGEYRKELQQLLRDGWVRVRVDGAVMAVDDAAKLELARYEKHTIEVIVDRMVASPNQRGRLAEAVSSAARLGQGVVTVWISASDGDVEQTYSLERACPDHPDVAIPELEPRLFSFNAPQGACPTCDGLGALEGFDATRLVDASLPIGEGFLGFNEEGRLPFTWFDRAALLRVAAQLGAPVKRPLAEWSEALQQAMLRGDPTVRYQLRIDRPGGAEVRERPWRGLVGMVEEIWEWTKYTGFERFRTRVVCPTCDGARLHPVARAVTFRGIPIHHLTNLSVADAYAMFSALTLTPEENEVASLLIQEIRDRLTFLHEVGLDYLTLDRSAVTLSGGEAQRIRLASQVGSGLQGVTYVLDEPSIGLHPRDNLRLLRALQRLRDRGNSVLVVEHDAETMAAADHLVDVGPGAGREGGTILYSGPPSGLATAPGVTAAYARGERSIPVPGTRRVGRRERLVIRNAVGNNLTGFDAEIPLGTLTVLTGVSGSGKSTLVFDVLEPAVRGALAGAAPSGDGPQVEGVAALDAVVTIDQTPIGRTPRSNPATYTGALDIVRDLFASTPEARARGYKKGQFSFNVKGGRCEACGGAGVKTVEMQFLPDVEVVCDVCEGRRFNSETLEIRYQGRTISEVLDATIADAAVMFRSIPKLARILDTLLSVGLGYVSLGQPSTTLSGGEAQRMKLASELKRPATGKTLYLLDEPTTGLHFDDVARLLDALNRLVDAGNTVLVVEHNGDVVKCADHVLDLGPEGGVGGGRLVGVGTPEVIARLDTPTGRALAKIPELSDLLLVAEPVPVVYRAHGPREIRVDGARKHNLKAIDVRIPHGMMTVITGPSGSGKTSLAFDTIFSEGQRRYVESLSTYARRFLGRMERAPVDRLEGLAPAIAIDQHNASNNPRSTVATVTEIHDVLRLLYARVGVRHCPRCERVLEALDPSRAAARLRAVAPGAGWLTARLDPASDPAGRRAALIADGWSKVFDHGLEVALEDPQAEVAIGFGADLVIDRFDPKTAGTARVSEAVARAHALGRGVASFRLRRDPLGEPIQLAANATCPDHGAPLLGEVTPKHFSFNSRLGACEGCDGIGRVLALVQERVLAIGADGFWESLDHRVASAIGRSARSRAAVEAALVALRIAPERPTAGWSAAQRRGVLDGLAEPLRVRWSERWGKVSRSLDEQVAWPGLLALVSGWNTRIDGLWAEAPCPTCHGGRLKPALLSIRLGGEGIHQFVSHTVESARAAVERWGLAGESATIAERPLSELRRRLTFLSDVGLGYLALDRSADTLSGGEAQRIRLASQLGTGLTGVVYVLDEPTIGLHSRDTERLLRTLEGLRDLGNTLVVVEHDPDTIVRADRVVDLGPGAGDHGGRVMAFGTPAQIRDNPDSLTGRWLSGRAVPPLRAKRAARGEILLREPRAHNLRCGDVRLPIGAWTAVSGVSGSGKSTLVMDTLVPRLRAIAGVGAGGEGVRSAAVVTSELIDRVVVVDQSPLGRTPRSTPATACGIMDPLRQLFASLPGSRERGWQAGRFSFNNPGGRCEACEGRGAVLIEMHFLPDVWVKCDVCEGRRFDRETLEVRFKGKNIADLMAMRIDEAITLFENQRALYRPMQPLVDVGLGYLSLGQPATTLSGGEAQRVKLASELVSRKGHAVYVLDEPTTGLHVSDVARLVDVLDRLVAAGHTVVTVEHHLEMLAQADWVIDLGPEGGAAGGLLIGEGTPEQVCGQGTPTGVALARYLATRGGA